MEIIELTFRKAEKRFTLPGMRRIYPKLYDNGDIAQFKKITIPLVKQIFPKLIS